MLAFNLLRISVVIALIGMAMGIGMGMAQNFMLMPAHAHLNLLGYVSLFLAALYYHLSPSAAGTGLARVQATLAVLGALIMPAGICAVLIGGLRYEAVPIVGSLIVLAGMLLFVVIVFRHGLPAR